jgi:hypothetical protein
VIDVAAVVHQVAVDTLEGGALDGDQVVVVVFFFGARVPQSSGFADDQGKKCKRHALV